MIRCARTIGREQRGRSILTPSWLIYGIVLIALNASFSLSVNALLCHQCNSHLENSCHSLRLRTPRTPPDNQYLKLCAGNHSGTPFCRKEVIEIVVTEEHRIVRSCGWRPLSDDRSLTCIDNDGEAYLNTICECDTDGCNGTHVKSANVIIIGALTMLGLSIVSLTR